MGRRRNQVRAVYLRLIGFQPSESLAEAFGKSRGRVPQMSISCSRIRALRDSRYRSDGVDAVARTNTLKAPDRTRQAAGDKKAAIVPRLFSIETVAAMLEVSPRTVRRWIAAGLLPVHRLGRQIRISEPDLAAFIARRRCS